MLPELPHNAKSPQPGLGGGDYEELTTGIEPVTSSLPRMCSTD